MTDCTFKTLSRIPVPSTVIPEDRLNCCENELRDSLSKVSCISKSSDEKHNRNCTINLNEKFNTFAKDSLALSGRKTQTGHIQKTRELNGHRVTLDNRTSYDSVKLLDGRPEALGVNGSSSSQLSSKGTSDSTEVAHPTKKSHRS